MTRPKTDWEAVERDYRTGQFTLKELEAKHGPNAGTILRHARKHGWQKDLTDAVRQATNAALVQEIIGEHCKDAQKFTTEAVLAAAEVNKSVVLQHRHDINEARGLTMDLLGELRTITLGRERLERMLEIAEEEMTEEQVETMRDEIRRLLSLSGRVGSLQKLADTMSKLQTLERKAFNLDADDSDKKTGDPMGDLMAFLQGGAAKLKPGGTQ